MAEKHQPPTSHIINWDAVGQIARLVFFVMGMFIFVGAETGDLILAADSTVDAKLLGIFLVVVSIALETHYD